MTGSTLTVDAASVRSGVAVFDARVRLVAAAPANVRVTDRGARADPFAHALLRAVLMGQEIALVAAHLIDEVARRTATPHRGPHRIIIEYPRIYKRGPAARIPSDDVLVLAASATAAWVNLSALYPDAVVEPVRPQDWKGQVKKKVMMERILDRLEPAELAVLSDADKQNDNVLDAVGIGLALPRV